MANINFVSAGSFDDVGPNGFNNFKPTSLQFGPDGRLYVAELNGQITAFTVTVQNGEYIVVDQEELTLPGGGGVVRSIQNHTDRGEAINVGDPGAPNVIGDRQVTGMYVTGTAANPVIYISSSDPRQGLSKQDLNLDTNSGVLTRVTLNENGEWEAVDLIRGLPRSEENHSVNGITLNEDETKLYLAVGSNTNNGGLSDDFAFTAEYALSSTILEIDLVDLNSRTPQLDPVGGQNGTPRLFVYDLPTLDDPTVENVTDGVGEDEFGLDEGGPWGGNDGFNQAILPADAPLRIYADGVRNNVDLIFTEDGRLYTIDNGSNGGAGGNPSYVDGEAINAPNEGGMGDDEPLLLIEEGGYYGHPVPVRSNQNLAWTVYNDAGEPDSSLPINTVPDISALVPDSVNIPDGFVIDPSKFTGDPARLTETGIRIQRRSNPEIAVFNYTGGSSNGLVEYTDTTAFGGALAGTLFFADFNGSIQVANLNEDGTALEPLIDPRDGQEIGANGQFQAQDINGKPLDVTVGPDGTIWVADFTAKEISVYAPSDVPPPPDFDADDDGILNVNDPFIRDVSNGGDAVLTPGQTLTWTFSANQTDLPGRGGYGGGLTGVMLDGSTDFEAFLSSPATFPNQSRKIDNVKTLTASGGGTTVIEFVSNGDPLGTSNSGEYLFHTGVTIDAMVDTFTVSWNIDNPTSAFTGPSQQIGGYIGTGDQSNYLKLVATQDPGGEIQILLEDEDVVVTSSFIQADDLFTVPNGQNILFELEVNPTAATATPTVTYGIGSGQTSTVSGAAISLAGTNVLDAIQGNYSVKDENNQDVTTGLALGLFSSNVGQPPESLQGITFKDIAIRAADPALSLTIAPATISENGGVATATVTRNTDTSTELTVNISSSDTTEATVPTTVTIPAGQDSVTFDVTAVDDAIVDETQTPTITVSAAGFIDGTATVDVFNDDEPPALSLVISPSTLSEKAGVAAATITRTGDIGAAVTVSLASSDTSEATVPATVVIPAGQASATFDVTIADDTEADGTQSPVITASAAGLVDGVASLSVTDDDDGLSITLDPTSISENGGTATGTVTRTGDINSELTVSLASNDTSEATVPTEVTILAGEESATFTVTAVDDTELDGTQTATITASATDLADGVATLEVTDDEVAATLTLSLDPTSISENGGIATGTVTRSGDTSAELTVALTSDDTTEATVPTEVVIPAGQASVTFDVTGVDDTEVDGTQTPTITASAAGFANGTAMLNVTDDDATTAPPDLELSKTVDNGTPNVGDTITFTLTVGNTGTDEATGVTVQDLLPNGFSYVSDTSGGAYDATTGIWTVGAIAGGSNETIDITVTVEVDNTTAPNPVLYRVNVGGPELAAPDSSSPVWSADTNTNQSPFRVAGQNGTFAKNNGPIDANASVSAGVPVDLFRTQRFDGAAAPEMRWEFATDPGAEVEVRLYFAEIAPTNSISGPGERVFDVAVEGDIPPTFTDIDQFAIAGESFLGFVLSETVTVSSDGILDLEFIRDVENPSIQGIEIVAAGGSDEPTSYENYAQVLTADQADPDSTPGNDSVDEDDDAIVTVVPTNFDSLTLVLDPTSIPENGGTATATVTRSGDTSTAITVTLASSNTTAATVPTEVVIPAGQASATFDVTVVDDDLIDGTQTAIITATAPSLTAGTAALEVTDDEVAGLTVTLDPTSISENGGIATATVTRNTDTSADLTVTLSSSDTSEATVPTEVVISAGQTSATFDVTAVDDAESDGTQTATITASATGLAEGTTTLDVTDDEPSLTADLSLIKTVDTLTPAIGETVTFTLTVNNSGTDDATGVSVADLLPNGLIYVSDTSGGAYDTASGIWDVGTVLNGETATIDITATVAEPNTVIEPTALYRVNVGGPELAAADGSALVWSEDTNTNPSPFRVEGQNGTFAKNNGPIGADGSVPASAPVDLFRTQRFDGPAFPEMQWEFAVDPGADVEVRLYFAEIAPPNSISGPGERVFDVAVEGNVPSVFTDVDPFAIAGESFVGFMLSETVTVSSDGILDLEFIHDIENPSVQAIEILQAGIGEPTSYTNYAQILTSDQLDPDSTPGDNSEGDDDDSTVTLSPVDVPQLTLTLDPTSITENGGIATATVTREGDTSAELTVTLTSSDTSEATVPATVVIAAGETSVTFDVTAVDDAAVDGTQTATITAAATDFVDGTASLAITDDEVPGLSLTVDPTSVSENGEIATATVTREGDTSTELTVTLTSSDTSAATIPATVVIAAGETSVTFDVTAVDDAAVDGTQTPTLTATAAGFADGTATLDVTDDEVPGLTVAIAPISIVENGGTATATVTRTGDTSAELTVDLTSSDLTAATVPATVVIPAGQTAATFTVTAVDDAVIDGTQTPIITASASGFTDGSDTVDVLDDETPLLTLAIAPDSISELDGTATAIVTRNGDTSADLTVTLTSSDTSEAIVPATVVIPAGQDAANFQVTAVDDLELDGTQAVTVTAAADGFTAGTDTLDVTDDEIPQLTVTLDPGSVSENGGIATATVTREGDTSADLTVMLTSSDTSAATVPTEIVIPAGQAAITVDVTAVDDAVIDGTQSTTITATAAGFTEGIAALDVLDDEVPGLTLTLDPSSISENGGIATATLTREGDTSAELTVTLTSSDTSEATVPTEIVIPAGQASATFDVTGVDDAATDGPQTTTITATATGLADGVATLDVIDDEVATPQAFLGILPGVNAINASTFNAGTIEVTNQSTGDLQIEKVTFNLSSALLPKVVFDPAGTAGDSVAKGLVVDSGATATGFVEPANNQVDPFSEPFGNGGFQAMELNFTDFDPGETVTFSVDLDPTNIEGDNDAGSEGSISGSELINAIATVEFSDGSVLTGEFFTDGSISGSEAIAAPNPEPPVTLEVLNVDLVPDANGFYVGTAEVADTVQTVKLTGQPGQTVKLFRMEASGEPGAIDGVPVTTLEPFEVNTNVQVSNQTVTLDANGEATLSVTLTQSANPEKDILGVNLLTAAPVDATGTVAGPVTEPIALQLIEAVLTLSIEPGSISEDGGVATAAVTRNTATTEPLVVELDSSDTFEATVPETVTIPAGQASVTFPVTAADDITVDGTQIPTITASADGLTSASATLSVTDDDAPNPNAFLFTVNQSTTLNGVTITPQDIGRFDGTDYHLFLDGSDIGITSVKINAFDVISDTEVLLSFDNPVDLPSVGPTDDSDVVKFTATGFGENSSGNFSKFIDGSDVALGAGGEDIDGLVALEDGTVLLSTTGNVNLGSGVIAVDEDVLLFIPTLLGNKTEGTFSLFIDGSDIGLDDGGGAENLDALSLGEDGNYYVSTQGNFNVGTVTGADEDVALFTANATGEATDATFASALFFDGSQFNLGNRDIQGIDLTFLTLNNIASLSLSIDPDNIAENGGTATATVTRSGDTSADLTVNLTSSDTSEATVPATVVIPAGQAAATFTITAIDDAVFDGDQTPTITATAVGLTDGSATLTVTDDEVPGLTLTLDPTSIAENGGVATATVTRTGDTSEVLTVELSSSDTGEAAVPAIAVIAEGETSTTFDVTGVDDSDIDGTQTATITASANGFTDGAAAIDITDDDVPSLTLDLDQSSIVENGGVATATITRNGDLSTELVVSLSSDDTSEATVPDTVTIAAGAATTTFDITGVDDLDVDGTQTPTITATAAGFTDGIATLDVVDDDSAPELSLSIDPAIISENGGTATATVVRSGDTSAELVVSLSSDDTSEATVPDTVTIAAGEASATFDITGVDDVVVDGTQTPTITASAAGLIDGTAALGVTDDDAPSPGEDGFLLTVNSNTNVGGITITNQDIAQFNDGNYSLFFDGSDVGLNSVKINAFDVISETEVLISFDAPVTLDGVGEVDDSDVVLFTATSFGDDTEGTFSLYFDGSDVGLTSGGEDIDGLVGLDDGSLLISVNGNLNPGSGTLAANEDIVLFTPTSTGSDTTGTFSLFFDGSDVGLDDETVDAFGVDAAGDLYFSLINDFVADGLDTQDEDVFAFTPTSTGDTTTGSFASELFFDGSEFGLQFKDLKGIDLTFGDFVEVPTLSLSLDADSITENGGTATATVIRTGATDTDLTVNLTSSDTSAATVPATVVIPAGQASATFTVTGVDDAAIDGPQTTTITASAANFAEGAASLEVTDDEVAGLALTLNPTSITENGGIATATVTRNGDLSEVLTVNLSSSDEGEAAVPAIAVIPAGATSTTFDITGVDDNDIDGTQTATITASATGLTDGAATVDITDDDIPSLTLDLDQSSIAENGGVATATITRNGDTSTELVVSLSSDDTSEATVPATVTIAAGQASATFEITGADDVDMDGTQTPTITATAAGFSDGFATLDVIDNDSAPELSLSIDPAIISENGGTATATVVRSGDTSAELVVSLSSDDTSEATVPATVTIAAGEASATFTVDGVDDAVVDGTQTPTITASAAGLIDGTAAIGVTDDDVPSPTEDGFLLTLNSDTNIDGLSATTEDILQFDGTDYSLFFDGSDVGLTSGKIDAFDVISETEILLSFANSVTLDGIGTVDDSDLVLFTATSLGETTAGTFELYFDASDVGLSSGGEDIDALVALDDGSFLFSTVGNLNPGNGIIAVSEDVTLFSPTSLGEDTAGSFSVFVDGSDIELELEAIDGFSIDAAGDFFFSLTNDFTISGLAGTDEDVIRFTPTSTGDTTSGSYVSELTFDGSENGLQFRDIQGLDFTFGTLSSDPGLSLSIDPASISENGGTATATIIRSGDTSADLTVNLTSSDTSEATVPSTVVIPAGQASATFAITGIDDTEVDGSQTPTVTATAAGFTDGAASLEVTDDEVAGLTLSIDPASITENGGVATATVTRNGDLSEVVTVNLASDDESEVTVPATVTIAAGTASATFDITAVDDTDIDGLQTATITATAAGLTEGVATIDVTDDDVPSLSLSLDPDTISENGGVATATVTRNGDTSAAVTVNLTSSDTSEATVPATVVIAAGETTTTFDVTGVDDTDIDGPQVPTITAAASGLVDGVATLNVTDDDGIPELSINDIVVDESAATAEFTVSLSAAIASPVTVNFATAIGTAADAAEAFNANDYVAVEEGTLTFNPGETTQTIAIDLLDDLAIEGDEDFTVNLADANGAAIADGTGTATITDNDGTQLSDSLITYNFVIGSDEEAESFTILPTEGDNLIQVVATASEEGAAKNVFRSDLGFGVAGETDGTFNDQIDSKGPGGDTNGTGGLEELLLTFSEPVKLETVRFTSSNSDDDYIILVDDVELTRGVSATSPKFLPLDFSSFNGIGTEFTFTVVSNTGADDYALAGVQVSAVPS